MRSFAGARVAALLSLLAGGCVGPARAPQTEAGPGFVLEGRPFCFAGANNYYVSYAPRPAVDDLLDAARTLNFKVLRVWGMLDRGSLDGSVENADGTGDKNGVYFQYWDAERRRPAYNDGPDGLERLDYVVQAAAARGLKLIVVLVNNWRAFGGIDQYLIWYGRTRHHEFFTLPETRNAYRDYLEHLITRKNTLSGLVYRDDPTILAWELANEPRCNNGSRFDAETGWDSGTLTSWAGEMSDFVKTLDPNHLVSVGDEGFLKRGGEHWAYRGEGGVDHAALSALPSVDFATFHLYPDEWHTPAGFGRRWIAEHVELGRALGKPSVLEEYGRKLTAGFERRREDYRAWHRALLEAEGRGSLAWMLSGRDERAVRYPDYDHYAFYRDDATGRLLADFAHELEQACGGVAPRTASSPFVGVTRPPRRVALGWLDAN